MLSQEERDEIIHYGQFGLTITEIVKKTGRSINTIYRLLSENSDTQNNQASESPKKLIPYLNFLQQEPLKSINNVKKIFLELKKQGYQGSYASLNRYLKNNEEKTDFKYTPAKRFETQPGEQAQVDWGSFGKIELKDTQHKLYCFVYVLGYSRMMYIEFTVRQNIETFLQCHINAFNTMGIPKTLVYDNLKTVVLKREKQANGILKPYYNPIFLDFSRYYGFAITLCAPYHPRSKGKVEAGVKYVRNHFVAGMNLEKDFRSLQELNVKAKLWIKQSANQRFHTGIYEEPNKRWQKEKNYLKFPQNLPVFNTSSFAKRNSTKDGLIQYKSNFYSVPMKYARRKLYLKEVSTNGMIQLKIYSGDSVIASHPFSLEKGKLIVVPEHSSNGRKIFQRELKKSRQFLHVSTRPLSYYDQLFSAKHE